MKRRSIFLQVQVWLLAVCMTAAGMGQLFLSGTAGPGSLPDPLQGWRFPQLQTGQKFHGFRAQDFFPGRKADSHTIGGPDSGLINLLLIGQDRRPGEGRNRSDSMILCTISPADHRLTLTSVMRDLYVSIPGHGKDRINAAYALGGTELLDRTLAENLGILVDGNIEVDFEQFTKIIDTLGGVTLELREDEAREINRLVGWRKTEPGIQKLWGDQALAYVRIRRLDLDSDFSRTLRQRKLLTALAEQYRSVDRKVLLMLLKDVLPNLKSDIGCLQALELGTTLLPILKDLKIVSQQIPAEGEYVDRTIRGMAVLVADLERTSQRLHNTLKGSRLQ